jgi:demethylmenaquinone methyltransferase/2-methoxy-6-polyprenyl-1,4-benzoquinol methylase
MFARIAGRYDLLNRVLSLGIDRRWRRRTVRAAGAVAGEPVLDVCCGTGDLSADFARAGARVAGVDFTARMLAFAGPKLARCAPVHLFARGDALRLPVRDRSVAVASMAFGLRNLADADRGLRELARVVRPGGRVLVLEFSTPPGRLLGGLYRLYFTRLLPRIGALVSGDPAAYRYLPDTVLAWERPEALAERMRRAGLEDCRFDRLTGGIACLHSARVPVDARRP